MVLRFAREITFEVAPQTTRTTAAAVILTFAAQFAARFALTTNPQLPPRVERGIAVGITSEAALEIAGRTPLETCVGIPSGITPGTVPGTVPKVVRGASFSACSPASVPLTCDGRKSYSADTMTDVVCLVYRASWPA